MDLVSLAGLFGGFVLLVLGGHWLVRGASSLATTAGISPLVVGLTVVAFGTSAPELATSLSAALTGRGDIALGNVVGSNTFNVLFILGIAGLIAPLAIQQKLVKVDVPLMVAVSALTWWLARDGLLDRTEGLLLLLGLLGFIVLCVKSAKIEPRVVKREYDREIRRKVEPRGSMGMDLVLIGLGLAVLVAGSQWFVDGAVVLAQALGASELVIGLTIVAAGTSMPEVATSAIAAWRGERDIAVGNVVGSNLFNLLGVLGIASAVAPQGIPVAPAAQSVDLPVMFAAAAICVPICFTGARISRPESAFLLCGYAVYVAWLVFSA